MWRKVGTLTKHMSRQALQDLWAFTKDYLVPLFEFTLVRAIEGVGKAIGAITNIIGRVVTEIKALVQNAVDAINFLIAQYNRLPFPNISALSLGGGGGAVGKITPSAFAATTVTLLILDTKAVAVPWVARRVYMTRAELTERFGKDMAKNVPITTTSTGTDTASDAQKQSSQTGEVYEIWDKPTKMAYWVCKGYTGGVLDKREDPLGLTNFFPCPPPLNATTANDSTIPVADYVQYQDQADELDELNHLRLKVVQPCRLDDLNRSMSLGLPTVMCLQECCAQIPVCLNKLKQHHEKQNQVILKQLGMLSMLSSLRLHLKQVQCRRLGLLPLRKRLTC